MVRARFGLARQRPLQRRATLVTAASLHMQLAKLPNSRHLRNLDKDKILTC